MSYQVDHAINAHAVFLFAHGAGAGLSHDFMAQVTHLLVDRGITVVRFNFPYMVKREQDGTRQPPDRMPRLLASYQEILSAVRKEFSHLPLFIGGKSMGSRVAATLAGETLESSGCSGVICLGYPFHPQGQPDKLRLEPIVSSTKPILIIQGQRDALGNQYEIANYPLSAQDCCSTLSISYLPDGDHDFKPRVKSGVTHQQNIAAAVDHIVAFIHEQKI